MPLSLVNNGPGFLNELPEGMHALTWRGGLARGEGGGLGSDSQGGKPRATLLLWDPRPVTQPSWSAFLQLSNEGHETISQGCGGLYKQMQVNGAVPGTTEAFAQVR